MEHQVIYLAQEQFRGQVASQFAAQAADDRDGLKWKLVHVRRDIAAAALAGDHEDVSICRALKHETSIGEQKANV
jgi:hypothetical protein